MSATVWFRVAPASKPGPRTISGTREDSSYGTVCSDSHRGEFASRSWACMDADRGLLALM